MERDRLPCQGRPAQRITQLYITALALLRHRHNFGAPFGRTTFLALTEHPYGAATRGPATTAGSNTQTGCSSPVSTQSTRGPMTRSSISRFVCLILLTATPAIAAAQTGTITGRVTDSTTSAPMAGATVRAISGTTTAGSATAGE